MDDKLNVKISFSFIHGRLTAHLTGRLRHWRTRPGARWNEEPDQATNFSSKPHIEDTVDDRVDGIVEQIRADSQLEKYVTSGTELLTELLDVNLEHDENHVRHVTEYPRDGNQRHDGRSPADAYQGTFRGLFRLLLLLPGALRTIQFQTGARRIH